MFFLHMAANQAGRSRIALYALRSFSLFHTAAAVNKRANPWIFRSKNPKKHLTFYPFNARIDEPH